MNEKPAENKVPSYIGANVSAILVIFIGAVDFVESIDSSRIPYDRWHWPLQAIRGHKTLNRLRKI